MNPTSGASKVKKLLAAVMIILVTSTPGLHATGSPVQNPISVDPENPRYFLFRGRPIVLVGSSEHYGSLINRDFNYVRYLDSVAADGLNATRVFNGVYRELQEDVDSGQAGNTLAPKPERFQAPWPRTDQPGAADGLNKFDLTRWNEAYFTRLKAFVQAAGERGIVVEMVLFSNFYDEAHWSVSPLNAANNVNGMKAVSLTDTLSLKDADLLKAEDALVGKIAAELSSFDNVYYEICNEPFLTEDVLKWESHIVATLSRAEAGRARHLIAQEVGPASRVIKDPIPGASVLMFHTPRSEQVRLNLRSHLLIGTNETGFDGTADAPYRVQAWQYLMAGGAAFLGLDYSFTVGHEDGTFPVPHGQLGGGSAALRHQLSILLSFMNHLDLTHLMPSASVIKGGIPEDGSGYALSQSGETYVIYVHHGRSRVSEAQLANLARGVTDGLDLSGQWDWYVVDGRARVLTLLLDLPPGSYAARWMNPRTGRTEAAETLQVAHGPPTVVSPTYSEDIVLQIERTEPAH